MDAPRAGFFVARARHYNIGGSRRASFDEPSKGRQHGGQSALHVARAAAINPPVAFNGIKRSDRHAVDRDRVLMGVKEHRHRAARIVEAGDHVRPTRAGRRRREHNDLLNRHAQALEEAEQIPGHPSLEKLRTRNRPAHRIHAGQRDEIFEQLNRIHNALTRPAYAAC